MATTNPIRSRYLDMPLFPEHRLLFVHIPKNAGRSIEQALLGDAGTPDDGRRSLLNRFATALARETSSDFARKHLIGTLDVTLASQHLTYVEMELLGLLPTEGDLRPFAVVRNPYDRILSSVMHFSGPEWPHEEDEKARKHAFAAQLERWLDRPIRDHNERAHRRTQLAYLRDQTGAQIVETVIRFENLVEDFASLMQSYGLGDIALPFRGNAGRSRDYKDYYDAASRKRVEDAFGEDIDAFEYSF